MATAKRQEQPKVFEVVVSHDGLNVGERFTQQPDDEHWAMARVAAGYLRVAEQEAQDAGAEGTG